MENKIPLGLKIIALVDFLIGILILIPIIFLVKEKGTPVLFKLFMSFVFSLMALPFFRAGILMLKQHPYARPRSVYISFLLVVMIIVIVLGGKFFLQSQLTIQSVFAVLFSVLYGIWSIRYLTRIKIKELFLSGVSSPDKKILVKPAVLAGIFFAGITLLVTCFCMGQYNSVARKIDEKRISGIMQGALPCSLAGTKEIKISDGQLQIEIDRSNFPNHIKDNFISSHLRFNKNEDVLQYGNKKYSYKDVQAEKAALIYSFIKDYDEGGVSRYQENLFLGSFDGRDAKFLVIIAKQDENGKWQFYGKKEFIVTEGLLSK